MRPWLRFAIALAITLTLAWLMTSSWVCFGCGGVEFAEGATAAEKAAFQAQMKQAVVEMVWVSTVVVVVLVLLLSASAWPRRDREGDG